MMNQVKGFLGAIMDVALALIPLLVVLGVIFGGNIPFIQYNVVNGISGLIETLGSQGLVGLIVVGILWSLFRR